MKRIHFFQTLLAGLLIFPVACKKPNFDIAPSIGSIGTISNYLSTNFDFSLFYAAVQRVGMEDSLNQADAAYTVLAPLNSAFNKDSIYSAADFAKWSPDSLKTFVRTHILPVKLFYTDIPSTSDNLYKNLNGADLYFSEGRIFPLIVDGVPVQAAGTLSTTTGPPYGATQLNGVIYPLLNTLKVSKGTVQEFIASRPYLSHLEAGLKKFGLWDRLSGDGPFTVMAPPDTAFERYGLTADSIGRLDTSRYDPVLFGTYFITPNHLFVLDEAQLNSDSKVPLFNTISDTLQLGIYVDGNSAKLMSVVVGMNSPNGQVFLGPGAGDYGGSGCWLLGEKPGPNVYYIYPASPPYGEYINYACSNGVVHLLSEILLRPSDVAK